MKKGIGIIGLCSALLCTIGISSTFSKIEASQPTVYDNLKGLILNYYGEGTYKKESNIYIDESKVNEDLTVFFHAKANTTSKVTYYSKDALWMSRGSNYSYYGTQYENSVPVGVTSGTATTPFVKPINNRVVLSGTNQNSMEEYYVTLHDFIEGSHISNHSGNKLLDLTSNWSYSNGVYTSTNEDVIDGFRLFTAPLWLGKTKENGNYIDYTKATIQEEGSNLVMKLWTSIGDEGKLVDGVESDGDNLVFSKATVYKYNQNIQESLRTNFEGFRLNKTLGNYFDQGFGNFGPGRVEISEEANNIYGKLHPQVNGESSIITKGCNVDILKARTYRFEIDVKLGSEADGTLSFGIYNGSEWLPLPVKTNLDISNVEKEKWVTVSSTYTFTEDKGGFANFDLEYRAGVASLNNYVLIDNFRFIDVATGLNVDVNTHNDFEGFKVLWDGVLSQANVWARDNYGDIVYISHKLENAIIKENDNYVLKAYSSDMDTAFTLPINREVSNKGIYQLTMKVKLGSGATWVDNIGFRLSSNNPLGTGDMVFEGLDTLSSEEWVTLTQTFIISQDVNVDFINADFWVFTHNDVINSVDNYVLIDDVSVYRVA